MNYKQAEKNFKESNSISTIMQLQISLAFCILIIISLITCLRGVL